MASYKVFIKPSAAKELERLPKPDLKRVAAKIQKLARDPRPAGAEKLSGEELYRVRQGRYRIVYAVDDAIRIVSVVRIGHRKDVYR